MVLRELILSVSTMGKCGGLLLWVGCGGLEGTDF